MLNYTIQRDHKSGEEWIETDLRGKALLTTLLLNKGTAFTYEERCALGLLGKLPYKIETLEEQVVRAYHQYKKYHSPLQKQIYLNNLHDKNEVLFYKLVITHLTEMLPIIYTPIISLAVKAFSHEFRQPRGLYISYPDKDNMTMILKNRTHPKVDAIIVTDGERILGIGDQGVGGINIPIAKLMLYTICGGINPYFSLPIILDVGTDNPELLNDPLYLGWKHPRIRGDEYDDFIDRFVAGVKAEMPKALLHWEDFGRGNARKILEKYRDKMCTLNDDMQGTGVVTLAALLVAVRRTGHSLVDQKIVILGAGTAGVGIADQIVFALEKQGLSKRDARKRIWLVDKAGLLTKSTKELLSFQLPYARDDEAMLSLENLVKKIHPTVLIGCAGVGGAFSENIIKDMASFTARPIIFPLSNPNEYAEANPKDILAWTNGRALIATGSPFDPKIAQCNNALSFPGLGLGLIASSAKMLTDNMLWIASNTISHCTENSENAALLPDISQATEVAFRVALEIVEEVKREGLSDASLDKSAEEILRAYIWEPYYRSIRPRSTG